HSRRILLIDLLRMDANRSAVGIAIPPRRLTPEWQHLIGEILVFDPVAPFGDGAIAGEHQVFGAQQIIASLRFENDAVGVFTGVLRPCDRGAERHTLAAAAVNDLESAKRVALAF